MGVRCGVSCDFIRSLSLSPSTQNPSSTSKSWRSSSVRSTLIDGRRATLTCIRAQQSGTKDGSLIATPSSDSVVDELQSKEWEIGVPNDEIAATQGIRLRRRPPTGPPLHYVGPFEFHLQNEGNTPRDILEEIIWNNDGEVTQMKEKNPIFSLKKALDSAPPPRDFIGALEASYLSTGFPGLIAEVKKASPSKGILREDFDPVEIAKAYEKGGAACLSVLTDAKYFQGSFENLEAIRNAGVKCPLLCKEFIVDAWQLYYARTKGADAVLLNAAVLPDLDMKHMLEICKMIGLTALVEVHDENEMDRVLGIDGIELIGINNRNLGTFEVDISNTKKLLEGERGEKIRQKDIIVVGESRLFALADANALEVDARDWYLDSGAEMHVCDSKDKFVNYRSVTGLQVFVANNASVDVAGIGTVKVRFTSGNVLTLRDVLHVPTISKCLISVSKLDENGFSIYFEARKVVIVEKRIFFHNFVGKGCIQGGMYRLNIVTTENPIH